MGSWYHYSFPTMGIWTDDELDACDALFSDDAACQLDGQPDGSMDGVSGSSGWAHAIAVT